MTGDLAIRVENLGKVYRIGQAERRHDTLAVAAASALTSPIRNLRNLRRLNTFGSDGSEQDTIRALDGVSFDVKRGDVIGFIGRNGAGKSTLLKVLSRITEPTSGRILMRGRVSSLLEVGTGFHPDLSGRENIYLNGTIMGMRKREIDRKFDQIVDFSSVEKFVDTPIKRYSSGMRVRLAFAVAAHLEPDILIVDEVLAVGDAEFQKKCLSKMEDVAGTGRTVLFVSHNMGVVQGLCNRGIVLRDGRIIADETAAEAVDTYLSMIDQIATSTDLTRRTDRKGLGKVQLVEARCLRDDAMKSSALTLGKSARFEFAVSALCKGISLSFKVVDQKGTTVCSFATSTLCPDDKFDSEAGAKFACIIDPLLLVPGRYRLDAVVATNRDIQDNVEGVLFFDVDQGTVGRRATRGRPAGVVEMPHVWVKPIL